MDWKKFLEIIRGKDPNMLVCKAAVRTDTDFMRDLVALANTKGGHIVVGLDLLNFHLRGIQESPEWYAELIKRSTQDALSLRLEVMKRDYQSILVIHVEEGSEKPYLYEHRYYERQNGQTVESVLDINQIKRASETKGTQILVNQAIEVTESAADEELDDDQDEQSDSDVSFFKKEVIEYASKDYLESEDARQFLTQHIECIKRIELDLNSRQKRALTYLKTHISIRNKQYRKEFDVSHKTAHIELVDLVEKGILVSEGLGRNSCYTWPKEIWDQLAAVSSFKPLSA